LLNADGFDVALFADDGKVIAMMDRKKSDPSWNSSNGRTAGLGLEVPDRE
jgi:hypothetical protein